MSHLVTWFESFVGPYQLFRSCSLLLVAVIFMILFFPTSNSPTSSPTPQFGSILTSPREKNEKCLRVLRLLLWKKGGGRSLSAPLLVAVVAVVLGPLVLFLFPSYSFSPPSSTRMRVFSRVCLLGLIVALFRAMSSLLLHFTMLAALSSIFVLRN